MIFRSKGLRRASLIAVPAVLVAAGSIALATMSNAASTANGNSSQYRDGRYIVTFADDPVATYDGYAAGFAATKPNAGQKLNRNSAAVKGWQAHLTSKHDAALAKVGASKI